MPKVKKVVQNESAVSRSQGSSSREERQGMSRIFSAVGRRKSATAQAQLTEKKSSGDAVTVNGQSFKTYFSEHPLTAVKVLRPLEVSGLLGRFVAAIKVRGGGKSGQIDAVTLAIARAVIRHNPELKPLLRKEGLLTRDPREKERKKPGFLRARKKPQYSKR